MTRESLGLRSEQLDSLSKSVARIWLERRTLWVTEQEQLCWAPRLASHENYIVALLTGCTVPVILSPNHSKTSYYVRGPAIVDGVMDGEIWNKCVQGEAGRFEDFDLV